MLPTRSKQYPADQNLLTWRDNGISRQKRHVVVIHTDESAWDYSTNRPRATGWTAKRLAEFNIEAPNDKTRGSYHIGIDGNAAVVRQNDDIYGTWSTANKGNDVGFHICLAGTTAYWSRADWLKRTKQLQKAAEVAAFYCLRYGYEIKKLLPNELRAGNTGIAGHWDCTKAWSNGSGHWDPGGYSDTAGGFPWDIFMQMVRTAAANADKKPSPTPTPPPAAEKEQPVLKNIQSIINPKKSFSVEQALAYIDGSIWKQERLVRALCVKNGIDPDEVIKEAVDHDLAGAK